MSYRCVQGINKDRGSQVLHRYSNHQRELEGLLVGAMFPHYIYRNSVVYHFSIGGGLLTSPVCLSQ
jgi:hypothetical protein